MRTAASFRYQILQSRSDVLTYYLALAGLTLLSVIWSVCWFAFHNESVGASAMMVNGLTSITSLFLFVESLCSFKDNFGMALQNGVTRKSLFLGRLACAAALCGIMAVLDEAITLLLDLVGKLPGVNTQSVSLMSIFFPNDMRPFSYGGVVLCSVAFSFCLLLAAAGLGYFITVLYYRLNTPGKVAVSAGVPGFFIFVVPALKSLRDHLGLQEQYLALERAIEAFFSFLLKTPWHTMAACLVFAALFHLLAWLLIRRAALK